MNGLTARWWIARVDFRGRGLQVRLLTARQILLSCGNQKWILVLEICRATGK
jgi:hypothetical protein